MTRKYLLIGLFLVISANTSCNQNINSDLKKLRGDFLKKELELSELGKNISEQETIISSYSPKFMAIYEQAIEKRKDTLHKNAGKNLTAQERSEITDLIDKNFDDFLEKLKLLLDPSNKERVLVQELFKKEEANPFNSFDSIKFHTIRTLIEFAILATLVEQYEDSLREFVFIADQIETLEKNTSTN
jgi:hypothetical protein